MRLGSSRLPASFAALSGAVLLAGCVASGPIREVDSGGPVVAAPQGFDGEWLSTDGVAVSRFTSGQFQTFATDTGNVLADGSYRLIDTRTAQITVVSRIRQTTNNVNCALATTNQLNCTSSTGQNFVLTRRAALPA
ncbi:MAG: hypothetical protein DI629_13400 [Mesorhizobium amorphae]|nr:MAG: hypothetical protein DI629_13400 [Mesorhizobium amorphae]